MAVKRYKAGTIFLDVAPSFDNLQRQIKQHIEDGNLEKAAEEQGRKQGEALAKGEDEAYRKAAEKNLAGRQKANKAVNKSMVDVASKAYRDIGEAAERSEKGQTQATQKAAKERTKVRRTEAQEAENLLKQVDWAHGEAHKAQTKLDNAAAQRRRDQAKEQATLERRNAELAEAMAAGRQRAMEKRIGQENAAQRKQAKDMRLLEQQNLQAYEANQARMAEASQKAADRAARERAEIERQSNELAEAMAAGRERAMERRIGRENALQRQQAQDARALEQENLQAYEANQVKLAEANRKAAEERAKADKKAADDKIKADERAARESTRLETEAAREREKIVGASGGRMGRLIRKSVGNAVADLPPMEIDADSSKADRVVSDLRKRLIAVRDARIGVDIDSGKAQAEIASIMTALRTVARNHDGSVRINTMAALASLQALENKINSIQREARKPILMRLRTMGGLGDGKGIGADGANAFRAFNVAVLAVASAVALLGPLLTVATAGIATLAGAAIAGGAGLGVLALGFQGVFQAIGDQIKAEDEVGQASQDSGKKRAAAAKQVGDAKRRLADAERNAARSTADAARAVEEAERGVAEARKQGQKDIADAARAEKDAARDVVDARRAAAEGVKNALQQEQDAQRNLADARRDAAEAVRNAIESEKDAQRNLADARRDAAEAVRNAIEQEKDAQRSLADTRRQVASDIESAIEQQSQAERRLEDAQRSATQAQRDLTEARREARREIEDLSMSYRQSQLAEAEAAVAITQAQERLNEVRRRAAKGDASQADVRQASIDVQQARLRAEEMRTRRRRAGADSARATRAGVEGSDRVRTAKERVRSADQQVVDSQRALAKASKNIADTRVKGAQRIADAERAVAKASQATAKARSDGARRIADAERAVEKAARNTARARADGARKVADAERALLKASEAVQKARRDGSRGISDAERALADASRNTADVREGAAARVLDAERGLADAQRAQRRTSEDNALAIADAQRGIRDAQASAAEATAAQSTAARNAAASMAALSPAGQRFARFILGLRGEFSKLKNIAQEGMLPGLEQGMRELGVYKSGFRRFVGDMSKMWGDLFASFGKQLTNDTWSSFFATMGRDAPEQTRLLSQAIFNVFETIAALTDAFSPLTTEMLTWLEKATAGWADWAANLKGSPGFERFLDYVREIAPIVRDFLLALGRAFIAVGVALAPFAEGFMQVLTKLFDYIAGMDPTLLGRLATGLIAVVIAMQLANGAVALMTSILNPLGSRLSLIVFAVTLVVMGLIYLYQTNDTARKYIDKFLGAMKALGSYLLEHIGTIAKVAAGIGALFILYKVVKAVMAVRKAMQLLGLTMKLTFLLNPYVLAIAALVGIIIYLWKTNESFRRVVMWAWEGVKGIMMAVVGWFTETGAPAMRKAFNWIAKKTIPIFRAALRGLGKVITWLWENAIYPMLKALRKGFAWAFRGAAAIVKWAWRKVIRPALHALNRFTREVLAPTLRWLWKNVVKPSFRAIGAAAKFMWRKVIRPAFRALNKFVREVLGPVLRWLWNKVAKPAFKGIGAAAKYMWRKVIRPAFRALTKFVKDVLGPALRWLWKKVVKPSFKSIGDAGKFMWRKVIRPVFRALNKFMKDVLGPAFKWLWKKIIRPAMRGIAEIVKWAWEKRVKPAFRKMRSGLDTLKDAFSKAKKGIRKIWKGLTDVVKDPINSALKFIQRNFIEKINGLLKKAGLDLRLPKVWGGGGGSKASGKRDPRGNSGGLQARASGGMIDGPWRGPRADNVLGVSDAGVPIARVNPREYITKVSSTEKMERKHPGVLDYINRHGDLPGHALGGLVGLPTYAKGGAVYKKMAAWVRKNLPGVQITSGYRPGAITATGNKSNHGKGKALDLAPSMGTFNKILKAFGGSKILELIYSPAGGRQISKGRRYNYPQPTRGDHWDHVHWAMNSMKGGGFGGGIGGFFDAATQKALDWITDKGKGIINKIPGKNIFTKMSKSLLKKSLDGIKSKVEEEGDLGMGGDMGSMPAGKAVSRWKSTVQRALKIMNQPLSLTNRVLNQIRTESGGNPRAINKWDSNAKMGIPSKGLLQTIDPTYRAYAHPKYNKGVYHPLSNILASMRYAMSRYGSLKKAYRGVGYAKGTDRATPGWHLVGEEGPELMRFRGGEQVYNRNQTMRLAELASKSGQGGGVQKVYVQNPWTGEYHEARMRGVVEEHADFEKSVQRMRR